MQGFEDDPRKARILIVDDDIDICRYVQVNLVLDGYDVEIANDGDDGLLKAFDWQPDLVLLDVMLPGLDGTEVCRRLRSDARTIGTTIIFLTARSQSNDKIVGLSAGADDYIAKPFDPPELSARVSSALRRSKAMRDISPLTGLPGNATITTELERRVEDRGTPFAACWCDLDSFKAFNDHYGFLRGDEAIKLTANVLNRALNAHPWPHNLAGHVGGDDFVLIADPSQIEAICKTAIDDFDERVLDLYGPEDLERGYIEVDDRQGVRGRFPVMALSVGVASSLLRTFATHAEVVVAASEMKGYTKSRPGSTYEVDRRRG